MRSQLFGLRHENWELSRSLLRAVEETREVKRVRERQEAKIEELMKDIVQTRKIFIDLNKKIQESY